MNQKNRPFDSLFRPIDRTVLESMFILTKKQSEM